MTLLDRPGLVQSGIQMAASGQWENAIVPGAMGADTLRDWLAAAGADVAIECLYSDSTGEIRGFIGFRCDLKSAAERSDFWLEFVAGSLLGSGQGPAERLRGWLAVLGHPAGLGKPSGTELGVFNQWRSAGPFRLRADRLTEEEIRDGPSWLRTGASAPICREDYWLEPERLWIAEVVSHPEKGVHVLDRSLRPL